MGEKMYYNSFSVTTGVGLSPNQHIPQSSSPTKTTFDFPLVSMISPLCDIELKDFEGGSQRPCFCQRWKGPRLIIHKRQSLGHAISMTRGCNGESPSMWLYSNRQRISLPRSLNYKSLRTPRLQNYTSTLRSRSEHRIPRSRRASDQLSYFCYSLPCFRRALEITNGSHLIS